MQIIIQRTYRGLGLLVEMNYDRALFVAALGTALFLGAYLGG